MANERPAVAPLKAGLGCRCPRCGQGRLFAGLLSLDVTARCEVCGLDLKFVDPGDGPAIFAIMILGFVMLLSALAVEFTFAPPVWLHVLIWLPSTLLVAVGLLRPLKAVLIALQYHHKAELGRLER
jgi:uncharacterized protein (DUF983 family)